MTKTNFSHTAAQNILLPGINSSRRSLHPLFESKSDTKPPRQGFWSSSPISPLCTWCTSRRKPPESRNLAIRPLYRPNAVRIRSKHTLGIVFRAPGASGGSSGPFSDPRGPPGAPWAPWAPRKSWGPREGRVNFTVPALRSHSREGMVSDLRGPYSAREGTVSNSAR